METIAVYREERVKVYGISEKLGLTLGCFTFPSDRINECGPLLQNLETLAPKFEFITLLSTEPSSTSLHVLFSKTSDPILNDHIQSWLADNPHNHFTIQHPVDLLFLHGPHFQDRDGIAEIAFSSLKKQAISPLVVGCAGTSMYIVVPQDYGPIAHQILSDTFLIPASK